MPFEPLDDVESVVSIEEEDTPFGKHFQGKLQTVSVLFERLNRLLNNFAGKQWAEEGVKVRFLKLGSSRWIKGKMRIKVAIEFCPDDEETTPLSTIKGESELDEFRG